MKTFNELKKAMLWTRVSLNVKAHPLGWLKIKLTKITQTKFKNSRFTNSLLWKQDHLPLKKNKISSLVRPAQPKNHETKNHEKKIRNFKTWKKQKGS